MPIRTLAQRGGIQSVVLHARELRLQSGRQEALAMSRAQWFSTSDQLRNNWTKG